MRRVGVSGTSFALNYRLLYATLRTVDNHNVPKIVVGAAIVRDGQVLAARRARPPRVAGGWEFPGGKVDAGEAPEEACVREVEEELGCRIEVVRRLPGAAPLDPGFVLHVYEARWVAEQPMPHEHDAIRWLGPEELYDVEWLDADRPFLPRLRERMLDGTRLAGGNVAGAVRIGDTVRRPTGPWTPAVHALLDHLESAGLDGVPRVRGCDARGREILTYLPGHVPAPEELLSDAQVVAAMRWLRRYHDAVAGFRPDGPQRWRFGTRELADDEIICHHDVAGYNMVFRGEQLVGLLDWDVAGPGRPLDDVAFFAWKSLPLYRPVWSAPEVVHRLRLTADAYGGDVSPRRILDHVVVRMTNAVHKIADGQRAGDPGMLNLAAIGEPDATRQQLEQLDSRLPAITRALDQAR